MNQPITTAQQVGVGGVYITYIPPGYNSLNSGAYVIGVGFHTDPDAAWLTDGNKHFKGLMIASVAAAKLWAQKEYGIKKWKKNAAGDWIDAEKEYLPLKSDKRSEAYFTPLKFS